jgi:hypothetical protein
LEGHGGALWVLLGLGWGPCRGGVVCCVASVVGWDVEFGVGEGKGGCLEYHLGPGCKCVSRDCLMWRLALPSQLVVRLLHRLLRTQESAEISPYPHDRDWC